MTREIPALERPLYFEGQRLTADDLALMERFDRELRWLHNRSLHGWGVVRGYAVAGVRTATSVEIAPGYALDCLGRELVLESARTIAVPGVATRRTFYLTASFAEDDTITPQTRGGSCGTSGAVRLPNDVVVRFQDVTATAADEARRPGVDVVLGTATVAGCRLLADLSTAEREDLKGEDRYVAGGRTAAGGTSWRLWPDELQPLGLVTTVDTSSAGFLGTPVYQAHVVGSRLDAKGGFVVDGYGHVENAGATSFDLCVVLPRGYATTAGSLVEAQPIERLRSRLPRNGTVHARLARRLARGQGLSASAPPLWVYVDLESPDLTVELDGVTTTNGQLALARVPAARDSIGGVEVEADLELVGPAGIAVDPVGNLYLVDPNANAVLRVDGCDGSVSQVPCLSVESPRGVAVGRREELFVSDGVGHRIVVIDLGSGQTIGVWGSADPYGDGAASDVPGLLNEPTDLAVDSEGRLYVVERGNRRIQRFSPAGDVELEFWESVRSGRPRPSSPEAVAVAVFDSGDDREERILVLDRLSARRLRVLAYRADGTLDRDRTTQLRDALAMPLLESQPGGIAGGAGAVYVGDSRGRRVLIFDSDGRFVGSVAVSDSAIAGLALDASGRLVVNVGGGGALRFAALGAVPSGTACAGPIALPRENGESLAGIRFETVQMSSGGQFQLFVWVTADRTRRPPALPAAGTIDSEWVVGVPNCAELAFPMQDATHVWIAARLTASGGTGPILERARLESGLEAWLHDLPAVYARDDSARPFLEGLLALLRAGLGEQAQRIDQLPLLFDADTADDSIDRPWLGWLAGWMAFPVSDVRAEERRSAVRSAFALSGRRGTAEGLRELIRLALNTRVAISEPAQSGNPWVLDARSALGFDTALVAAEAEGAIVGVTSTLDRSHLISAQDFGAPLFDDLAHHFCVAVQASDVSSQEARGALERLVERERPGHTTSHICYVEPRARVGFQARVGVDLVVSDRAATFRLGADRLGEAVTEAAGAKPAVGTTSIGDRGG